MVQDSFVLYVRTQTQEIYPVVFEKDNKDLYKSK